jgi:hypothetical protein
MALFPVRVGDASEGMKCGIEQRRVHTEGGCVLLLVCCERHLGEHFITPSPSRLQTLKNRSIFKADLTQNVIDIIDLDDF